MGYARNDQIRLHLYMDGVGTPAPEPLYYPVMGVEALTHSLGDITPVEVPDENRYGEYKIVDGIAGQVGRWTTSMSTRMPIGIESPLRKLERMRCPIDIHLNRGICDVPTDPNQFAELEIWEDVRITNYSTTALAALSSDARESTTESIDISIGTAYKIYNMLYALATAPTLTIEETASGDELNLNAMPMGIVIAPSWCCGSVQCGVSFVATGTKLYFVTKTGATTHTNANTCTLNSKTGRGDIAGIAAVGNRIIIARHNLGLDMVIYDKNGILNTSSILNAAAAKTLTLTVIDAIASNQRVGLCSSGLVVFRFDATLTNVWSVDLTGSAGASAVNLPAVAVSPFDDTMVAISDVGAVSYSEDGTEWKEGGDIGSVTGSAIAAVTLETWIAGDTDGELFMTADSGSTWTKVLDVTGVVNDIKVVTKHVLYAAIGSSVYRSVDGGASWSLEPNVMGRSFVTVTGVAEIAVCPDDPNNLSLACYINSTAATKDTTVMRVATGRPG